MVPTGVGSGAVRFHDAYLLIICFKKSENIVDSQALVYRDTSQSVVVAEESFGTPEALNNALRRWSQELPREEFIGLLNEAVAKVTEVVEQHENSRDKILISMYEVGRETLGTDFPKFKRTPEYRHMWVKVSAAIKNARKNQSAVERARQVVIKHWGDNGVKFLEFNSAQGWTKAASRLARACQDYTKATDLITIAIAHRLSNMRSGRSFALTPGLVDLQKAIGFFKEKPLPETVPDVELHALGVRRNDFNLLEPLGWQTVDTTSQSVQNSSFFWEAHPTIPQLPAAVIEELSSNNDESSSDNNELDVPHNTCEEGDNENEDVNPSATRVKLGGKATIALKARSAVPQAPRLSGSTTRRVAPAGEASRDTANDTSGGDTNQETNAGDQVQSGDQTTGSVEENDIEIKDWVQDRDGLDTSNEGGDQEAEFGNQTQTRDPATNSPEVNDIKSTDQIQNQRNPGHGSEETTDHQITSVDIVQPEHNFNQAEINDIAILSDLFHRLGYDIPAKLAEVSNDRSLTLDNLFDWWRQPIFRGLSLTQLATLETKIYLFHQGDKSLQSHQYGLIHQLLESDPLLWLLCVCLQKSTTLFAFPQPVSNETNHLTSFSDLGSRRFTDLCKIVASGHNSVQFNDTGVRGETLVFRPSLLPEKKVGNSIVVGDMAKEELKALKENRRPAEIGLSEEVKMSVKPWNIATTLRGLGPRADAVHLRRPYEDLEVQAEIDILLGKDRGLAWDFILQWRTMATEAVKLQFSIWVHLEQHLNRAYPLPVNAMGDKIVLKDSKEHETKGSGSGTPRRSRHIKRDSRELSPRPSPPKRQGSSGIGIWDWFRGG